MLPPKQDIVIFNCLQMQINKAIKNISKEIMIRNGTIQPDTDFFKCLQRKINKVTKNILKKNSKQYFNTRHRKIVLITINGWFTSCIGKAKKWDPRELLIAVDINSSRINR